MTSTLEGTSESGRVRSAAIVGGVTIVGSEAGVTVLVCIPLRRVVDVPEEVDQVADRVDMNTNACSVHEDVDSDEELFPDHGERCNEDRVSPKVCIFVGSVTAVLDWNEIEVHMNKIVEGFYPRWSQLKEWPKYVKRFLMNQISSSKGKTMETRCWMPSRLLPMSGLPCRSC